MSVAPSTAKGPMDTPQNAEIIEQKDEGEEVSSIAQIDPVQTEDLTKFAEGADPRGLCG